MDIFIHALMTTLGIATAMVVIVFMAGVIHRVLQGLDNRARLDATAHWLAGRDARAAQWRVTAEALMASDASIFLLVQELRKYPCGGEGTDEVRQRIKEKLRSLVTDLNIRNALYDISAGK